MLYKHMILDDVGVTKKIWSDYILVTFWLHIMVYGYTESDVIAESRGWNAMSGDNDVVCVLWICVVVGTESYVCDQLPKLPEEPPPIGDCAPTRDLSRRIAKTTKLPPETNDGPKKGTDAWRQ